MSQGWIDRNDERRYPLQDSVAYNGLDRVFGDMMVVLSGDQTPEIFSISAGPEYISFVIRAGTTDIAWYGGPKIRGEVLPLTPLVQGTSGTFVFGDGVDGFMDRVEDQGLFLAEEAYQHRIDHQYESWGIRFPLNSRVARLDGVVDLNAGANIQIDYKENQPIAGGGTANVIEFSIPETASDTLMDTIAGNAARNTQAGNCNPEAIATMNGVRAQADGTLNMRFIGGVLPFAAGAGNFQLVSGLVLTRACEERVTVSDYTPIVDLDEEFGGTGG